MDKKFIDIFRNKLESNDVVLEEWFRESVPDSCNIVGYHGTRLFSEELTNLKSNNFKTPNMDFFYQKLKHIENKCYRTYIEKKLKELRYTQSDNKIYLKFGKNDFCDDSLVFLNNWGGETIYNLYDQNGTEPIYEKNIGRYLRKRTKPYIVVCRVSYQCYKHNCAYGNCGCFDTKDVDIIDIIEVTDDIMNEFKELDYGE